MIAALFLAAALAPAAAPAARTSVGKSLSIAESVPGNVVAVFSDVQIDAPVAGNVIVWGGDVRFGPRGEVGGNLSVFGGEILSTDRPLPVRGAVSTPGALLRVYLEEMHRAPWDASSRGAAVQGLRIVALSLWLLLSLLLLYFFGSSFARAALSAEEDWSGALFAGALGVLTLFLAAAAALALLPASLSMPLAIVFAGVAVAAKVFGMAAIFLLLGQKILQNVSPARRPVALAAGFAALAAVSLLPVLGAIVWSVASVVAVGIAFQSRFGTPRMKVALPA